MVDPPEVSNDANAVRGAASLPASPAPPSPPPPRALKLAFSTTHSKAYSMSITTGLIWELGRWNMEPTGLKNTVASAERRHNEEHQPKRLPVQHGLREVVHGVGGAVDEQERCRRSERNMEPGPCDGHGAGVHDTAAACS